MTEEVPPGTEEEEAPALPAPAPHEKERPVFDLDELLKSRRGKGEGVGFWEVLAYLDYKDRKEEREWRREEREELRKSSPSSSSSPEVVALKGDVVALKKTVDDLLETIRSERQEKAQKELVEGVVKQTSDKILPEVQKLSQRLEELEKITTSAPPEETTSEITQIRAEITELADKIGEKVGKAGLTLDDVDALLLVLEKLEKRVGKTTSEVDYKTMTVSTIGELGKELIGAYRDIATSPGEAAPKPETPASTMQAIIKRQVQNYITQRMTQGATTMNIQEAAKELALTPGQVSWAYQTLMKEGWFHVRVPSKEKKVRKPVVPPEEGEETPTPTETGEEEQVFNPPEA